MKIMVVKKRKKWLLLTLCQPKPSCIIAGLSPHIAEVASAFMRTHCLETPVLPPLAGAIFFCASPFFAKRLKRSLVDSGLFVWLGFEFWNSIYLKELLSGLSIVCTEPFVCLSFQIIQFISVSFLKNVETSSYEFYIYWYCKTQWCCVVFFIHPEPFSHFYR